MRMSGEVMTVLGPVPAGSLGLTAMHEHLIADCSFSGNDPAKKLDDEDAAVEEMRDVARAGGGTVVDCTCHGLSPDYAALLRIAQASGVHVIASTGYYRRIVYPEYVFHEDADELAQRLIREVEEGMAGTGIRPGMLAEFASHDEGEPDEQEGKVFRAAGRVQVATGLPLTTHCWIGNGALWQIRALTAEGVPPDKIVIAHVGANRPDMDNARRILDTGVNVGIDCVGFGKRDGWIDYFDPERAQLVKTFIDWGHLAQLTVSRDLLRQHELKRHGGKGYSYLFEGFVAVMREAGISSAEIHVLLGDNPRRILTPV